MFRYWYCDDIWHIGAIRRHGGHYSHGDDNLHSGTNHMAL
jgi:hypothetical protein